MSNTWKCTECNHTNHKDINPCSNCNNRMSFGQEFPFWLKELPENPGGLIGLIVVGGFWVWVIIYMFSS